MKISRLLQTGIAVLILAVGGPLAAAEDLLKIEAGIAPRRLARGQEGKIILKVRLKKGIAVSALPAFTIEVEGGPDLVFSKNFFTGSDLVLTRVEIDGKDCLDLQAPIEIPFTVGPKARRGVYVLRGRVKFFAFDLDGKWCMKSSTKFSTAYSTWAVPVRTDETVRLKFRKQG
ncbi:MAG: hypothetical protein NTW38_02810 [Candidatus Aminicenantes bacterium]|nr:hypothetical protein [Candidatus Aminicenantes bacterium]